jgi:1-acyl-sn-glycerol-3-phosphate acyltransferase
VSDPVYRPVINLARLVFAAQGLRFDVRGSENVPRTGGAVMVINHIGYMDFTYAGFGANPSRRLVRFMAKKEVFDHKISGPLMRGMRHIPVDREAGSASFRTAVQALKDGEIVGVFPEATISRSFELKEFKAGAVRMASAAGVPLLPTILWGSQRVWTKDHPKRLGRTKVAISVSIGEPIPPPRGADVDAVTEELRARMTALLEQAQRDYPDRPRGEDD